jgi:hypothetical protein
MLVTDYGMTLGAKNGQPRMHTNAQHMPQRLTRRVYGPYGIDSVHPGSTSAGPNLANLSLPHSAHM